MKRKWAKKVKANPASKVKPQARTAAMIGLIISTGATHLILTRLGDSAPANQPLAQEAINKVPTQTEAGLAGSNLNQVEPKTERQDTVAALSTTKLLTPTPVIQKQETVEKPADSAIEHKEQTRQMPIEQAQRVGVSTRSKLTLLEPQKSLPGVAAVLEQNLPGQTEPQTRKLLQVLRVNRLVRQLKQSQAVAINSRFETVGSRHIASPAVIASSQIGTQKPVSAIREDQSTWNAKQKSLISRLKQKDNRLQDSLAQLRFEESKSSVTIIQKTEPISNYQKAESQSKTAASLGLLPGGTKERGEQINSQQLPQRATVFVIGAITPSANNQASVVVPSVVSEYPLNNVALRAIAKGQGLPLPVSLKANHLDNPNKQLLAIPVSPSGNSDAQNIGSLQAPKTGSFAALPPSGNVSYLAMGGDISDDDSVVATPPPNVEQIQQAQSAAAAQALLSYQYVQNLQTDIEKLRQKYNQGVLTTQALPTGNETRTTPVTAARTEEKLLLKIRSQTPASLPINPEFSANQAAKTLQLDGQKQHRVRPARTVIRDGVATAPLGTDAGLLGSFQEQNVSPALPPLGGVDNYLPKPTSISAKGLIWPARGKLTSGYGWRWGRMHKGVDIAAPIGTPVMAAAPGVVVKAGWNSGGYGNMVDIQHPDGTLTRYAHNKRLLVHTGEAVQQGEQISEMGSTGFSTGPHLHFEVHPMGKKAVNPIAYLPR